MTHLIDYDWVISLGGEQLHAPDKSLTYEYRGEITEVIHEEGFVSNFYTACGRRLIQVVIPGLFTRMGAKRCDRCCDALGYPRGVGSPKNDQEIRQLKGWK